MTQEDKVIDFIGESSQFDEFGSGYIWGIDSDGCQQMIAEVRGYGAIQNLFMDKKGKCDFEKADQFQDELGRFIAEAITEKIKSKKDLNN